MTMRTLDFNSFTVGLRYVYRALIGHRVDNPWTFEFVDGVI